MIRPVLMAPLFISGLFLGPAPKDQGAAWVDNFEIRGDASAVDADCIELTPDTRWARGSAWSKTSLNLNEPFDISLGLEFGDRDALGADGIVFVLAPYQGTGYLGEGIGYAGLRGSVGIELDTYQNRRQNDPGADHLALLVDGSPYHHHQQFVALPNLEDGRRHQLRVQWSPSSEELRVSVDGQLASVYPGSLVKSVLGERMEVSWGLTAGTGRKTNPHVVCANR